MTYLDFVLGMTKAAYQDGPVPGDLAGARNAVDMASPTPTPVPKPIPTPTPRPTPTQADILNAREGAVPGDLKGAPSAADVSRPKPAPAPTATPSPAPSRANVQPALAPRPTRPLNPSIEPMEKKKTPLDLPDAKSGMTQGHRLAAAVTAKAAFDLGALKQQAGDWLGQAGNAVSDFAGRAGQAIADYKPLAEKNVPMNMLLAGLGGAGIGALTGGKKHKMRNALLGALMASGAAGLGTYAARDHLRGKGREMAPQLPGWVPGSRGVNIGLQRLTGGLTDEAMDNHLTNETLWNKLRGE